VSFDKFPSGPFWGTEKKGRRNGNESGMGKDRHWKGKREVDGIERRGGRDEKGKGEQDKRRIFVQCHLVLLRTPSSLSYVEPASYRDWRRPLAGLPSRCFTGHSASLGLAIPPWVGAMSSGDDFNCRRGRNGEFCEFCYQDCWLIVC